MKRLGLIDIGSNTIRFVIFEADSQLGLNDILNIKIPARLSQYLNDHNQLEQQGIDILEETLENFQDIANRFNIDDLHPIATAALRQAKNNKDIIKQIQKNLDLTIKIISEDDEAYYGYYAIIHTTEIRDGIAIDIGGGSTEVTLFKDKRRVHSHSFPFGAVTLQRQYFDHQDPSDKESIKALQHFLKKQFHQLSWLSDVQVPLVGIGGSARNIARIHQAKHAYPISGVHNYTMDHRALEEVYHLLTHSKRKELKDLDGLSRDRVDLITPAATVFTSLFSHMKATQFTFSRKGLREGYIMHLINNTYAEDFDANHVSSRALHNLAQEYEIEPQSAEHRVELCKQLLDQLCALQFLEISSKDRWLFLKGAYLYYLGRFIDSDSSSPHTYYLIANTNIDGLTHEERLRLALLASFKNKTLLKFYSKQTNWLDNETVQLLLKLGGIIKFSNALNISHTDRIQNVELTRTKHDDYQLNVYCDDKPVVEYYYSEQQKKHIEKILKSNLIINFTKA
ncbi:exopolyphosphatase [Staphylococcus sp. SQ8-PEA]|uniref:exopolyphosphatase n=1 Tax=Staphylococcus marylandisciuri TaxID=2981529 RepID=A0ABT2QSK6_9STAP|nr:exopolyphosphatase [Staphylococcus marylandisciuri]MCU5746945.1 exopolyphosphatase [Staphylococcus marylandisciuri]